MEEIASRKRNKGKAGGVSFKLPDSISMLTVLKDNPVFDGEDFRMDGYVYRKNKRLRKWFHARRGWKHFWEPVMNDLARIERVYVKATARRSRRWAVLADLLRQIVKTGKKATRWGNTEYFAAHFYAPQQKQWGIYYITAQHGFSWDWLEDNKKPAKVVNRRLGDELWRLEDRLSNERVANDIAELLHDGIVRKLQKQYPDFGENERGHLFEVNLNGRKYLYGWLPGHKGYLWWQKVAWPGENYNILNW